jgi:hypothetical protein
MKKTTWLLIVLVLMTAWNGIGRGQEPGTTADPLVSKSYLDQVFRFHSVAIPAGDKLPLNAGALLTVRSGRVKLRAAPQKTLIDLTAGQEIAGNAFLPVHHLLLVPEAGGHFLEAQSLSLIMVMGLNPPR